MDFLFKKVSKKMNYLIILLLTFILFYFAIIALTYIFQRKLLYHPTENNYLEDELVVNVDEVKIKTQDNLELKSWYHNKNIKGYKTILFLHGNAGSLENRIHKINHFKDIKVNFLIISWRGFSGNAGEPNEKGLYDDANSAVKWLKSKGVEKKKYNYLRGIFRNWRCR